MNRIALIRSASSPVSKNQYNIQEIGLAKELVKNDMHVDVFLISDKDETYSEQMGIEERVTVYWLKGYKIPGQQGYYPDLKKILDRNHYDLIQALDDSQITTVLVSSYARKNGIKFVLWQGMYENYPEKYKRIIQYVFDWTLLKILRKNTQYCLAKTSSAKRYIESKRFPRAAVIPVGLELSNFVGDTKIDYREKLGIAESEKVLLYVGKVEERRKPLFCIDVFNKIKQNHPECCLVYVGKGPMLEEVHSYVKEKSIKGVHFVDFIQQKELPSLYAMSDMFILPTRYEIFGMVLMEAMYFGTPVITYAAAGPKDVIEKDVDGVIMDNFDADRWAEKIEEHVFVKNDCEAMGREGRRKIMSKYLWQSVAEQYFEYYSGVVNGITSSSEKVGGVIHRLQRNPLEFVVVSPCEIRRAA